MYLYVYTAFFHLWLLVVTSGKKIYTILQSLAQTAPRSYEYSPTQPSYNSALLIILLVEIKCHLPIEIIFLILTLGLSSRMSPSPVSR